MSARSPLPLLLALFLAFRAGICGAWEILNRIVIEHGTLVIDHSKTMLEITQAQATDGFPAKHGLGLFQSRVETELVIDQSALNSRRLLLTTRIRTEPVIYVAKEFPEDSCAYKVVLGHERLHQLFDLEVLRAMPDEIRAITRTVFPRDELEWTRALDLDRARDRFYRQCRYVYDSLSLPRHQAIDNPESYRRLGGQCNGEITRLLAARQP